MPLALDLGLGAVAVIGLAVLARKRAAEPGHEFDDRVNEKGIVPGDPSSLAKAAGVSLDVYALARCGQSEDSGTAARTAIMWATRNKASRSHTSIASLLLHSSVAAADGFFGEQGGRYAATSKAPTAATIELAKKVYAASIPDPTGGATNWDAPKTLAILHERNPKKYKTPEQIAANREAEGLSLVWVPGVTTTRFWRPRV